MAESDPAAGEAPGQASAVALSVVIPTYNRGALTVRAIESVLAQQSAGDLEIIVVNDGSTDATGTVLRARFHGDPRVRIVTTSNGGASAARNAGFHKSRGRFVSFLDSDDLWTPHMWASVAQVFASYPELVFVCSEGSTLEKAGQQPVSRVVAGDAPGWSHSGFRSAQLRSEPITLRSARQGATLLLGDFAPAILHGDLFSLSGLVMRRSAVIDSGPFTTHFRYFEDWEFVARLCLQGAGGYLDFEGFRRDAGRADQISRNMPVTAMPARHLYIVRSLPWRFPDCAAKYAGTLRSALIDAQYQMGGALARSRHRRWARRYLWRCIRGRYKLGKCVAHLARSLLPAQGR